jgi:predicted TIM-barrel fold metal-dependent hydrolase
MRAMAAVIGSGTLDRFPELRVGLVETGHGWLASWAFHVDEAADMVGHATQPLRRKPSEYVRRPQYSQSIKLHEGEGVLKSIIELLGPDTLMFAKDYPYTECWFPKSVETVLGWSSIPGDAKRQLLWDNGVRLYRRCEGL